MDYSREFQGTLVSFDLGVNLDFKSLTPIYGAVELPNQTTSVAAFTNMV